MTKRTPILQEMIELRPELEKAYAESNRIALLRHARMGEPVSAWRDGKAVWITPQEIFDSFGLDEFVRPMTPTERSPQS
jgi:hypothetical protein